jgi:hypothetical protein
MLKPIPSPEQAARRTRAYELYLGDGTGGGRKSLRAIALELGVTLGAVRYWREVDKWDERLSVVLAATSAERVQNAREVRDLLRGSLVSHLHKLNTIVQTAKKDADAIRGIREFVDIYRKLGMPPIGEDDTSAMKSLTFRDDLTETPETAPTTEDPQDERSRIG